MSHPTVKTATRPDLHRHCPLCGQDNRQSPPCRFSRDGWLLKRCWQCKFLYLENPPPVAALVAEYNWSATSLTENQRRRDDQPLTAGFRTSWKRWRRRWLPRRKLETLINRFVSAGSLLDVGCGTGSLFLRLPASIVPHGIEIDADAIEKARLRVKERGGRIIHADALSGLQAMGPAGMRGIVMNSFLEHDVRPLEVLQAAQRVLCDDGVLIIKVPNFACWNRRYWHGGKWPGLRFPDHVNYFTPRTLARVVTDSGLRIRRFALPDRLPTSDNMWLVAEKVRY